MNFLKYFASRFKKPYIYINLGLNFIWAWPIYATIIAIKDPEIIQNKKVLSAIWQFYLNGFGSSFKLMMSVSLGTMILFSLFYIWLRYKSDSVWERHYTRSVLMGAMLGFLNLFPTFFLYHFYLGQRNFETILFYTLIGPFISLAIVGPISLIAGAIIGLGNGLFSHIFIVYEKKKQEKDEKQ